MRELKNSSQKLLVQYEMIFYDVKCKKRSPIKMCDIVVITTKPMSRDVDMNTNANPEAQDVQDFCRIRTRTRIC